VHLGAKAYFPNRVFGDCVKGEPMSSAVHIETYPKLLTAAEVCALLRISLPTLHRWQKNILPPIRIGTARRWREDVILSKLQGTGVGAV
jgi:predicted DNA-binding transcriptional regulator AlpA